QSRKPSSPQLLRGHSPAANALADDLAVWRAAGRQSGSPPWPELVTSYKSPMLCVVTESADHKFPQVSKLATAKDSQLWGLLKGVRSSRVLARRPGWYCIRLRRVLSSAVSWLRLRLARLARDLFRWDHAGSTGLSSWAYGGSWQTVSQPRAATVASLRR